MSRDKRGNRTQEVVGSSPISSTKENKMFNADEIRRRFRFVCMFVCISVHRLAAIETPAACLAAASAAPVAPRKIPKPHNCRRNPDADCLREVTSQRRRFGENELQDEWNGDQRKCRRNYHSGRTPAHAREIDEPEGRRQAPVKRRVPKGVGNRQREKV